MWGLGVLILLLGAGALQARGEDAGRYLCRVTLEIPRLGTAIGNGTLLNVTAGLVWGLGGGLGGTALLLGLALLGHRCWRRDPETSIYMNTLPSLAGVPKKLPSPHTVMENSTYQGGL
ncbi:transmembrane and immunoglobulin domain-containing protein 2 isoform X7 [Columba livia]|uniref:transmembrane and immunoglobulin domain-containing protein 2 isoform X7 n=1 Tax=Columba livia TaxID=8932 RepID=UPI0031B9C275